MIGSTNSPTKTLMRHCYFDESIQERGGFIVGAYVFGDDADASVSRALEHVGLKPGLDEFKSSAQMSAQPVQQHLRDELREIVRDYRVGVLVAPLEDRANLGSLALEGLDQIARANRLNGSTGLQEAFMDEGLFSSGEQAAKCAATVGIAGYCTVRTEQDSRVIKGLQIADLVAHTAGVMLLDSLGLLTKRVRAGANSGYDENFEIDLGFEMWASLRYQFFYAGPVAGQDEIYRGALMHVGENGLFVAPSCSTRLRSAAEGRFGECYLGCVH